jgi:ABC-2 type transport system permease protein
VFGYSEQNMLTYILISNIVSDIVLSTRTGDIAGEILKGDLVNYILRPIAFFKYHAARDVGDKFLNVFFSTFEVLLIIAILKPPIFIQTNPLLLLTAFVFVVIGAIISYFVNMQMSFIAFWSNEVWAPRFIFYMLLLVFAGSFFPLDIMPKVLYYAFFFTPFPYLYYLPSRIYLGVPLGDLGFFFMMGIAWCLLSYLFTRYLWKKGLSEFSFFGR